MSHSVTVLIPVYNEEKTVKEILEKVVALDFVTQVIVVDDCSQDNSVAIIKSVSSDKIEFYQQEKNQGKTAAIRKALTYASGDITIIQDADAEYDPSEIIDVISPIVDGHADVVYGSRFLVKKTARVCYFYHYLANKVLTFLSNMFTNLNMTDMETCYKAFKTPIIKQLPLTSSGFGMEVEITALIARIGAKIYEVPISYYGRTYEDGKKIGLSDGIAALWYIFFYNLIAPKLSLNKRKYIKNLRQAIS